jgi:predicted DNA-binding protein
MDERVSVPLPADMAEWLKREAERQERPQAWVVRRCIETARQTAHRGAAA